MSRRVLITGVGAVTPLGVGARELYEGWIARRTGIEDGLGACGEFDPAEFMSTKEARRSDRFAQLAVAAGAQAVADAGWDAEAPPVDPAEVGCVIGSGIGGMATFEAQCDTLRERGPERVSALAIPLIMGNAAAGLVAMRHRLQGPAFGVMSACASGAHAIGEAARMIRTGEAQAVVAGGAEATLTPLAKAAFAKMEATSPTGISRPFDARRDGFVMGEGAGVLVLESEELAQERGARVLGEVLGYAATADAHHLTAPEPTGRPARHGDHPRAAGRRPHARGRQLHQRARHLDAAQRPLGDRGDQARAGRARLRHPGVLDQVRHRASARGRGRGRGDRHRVRAV